MLETVATGLLGSLFGGIFRLAPEVLKFFDAKNERLHELNMFKLQTDLEKIKGDYNMEQKYVDYSVAGIQAAQEAFKADAEAASNSYPWVSALVALVRPVITYSMFFLYMLFKLIMLYIGVDAGVVWTTAFAQLWTVEDWAILNMILSFHFVGRAIEKYQRK